MIFVPNFKIGDNFKQHLFLLLMYGEQKVKEFIN